MSVKVAKTIRVILLVLACVAFVFGIVMIKLDAQKKEDFEKYDVSNIHLSISSLENKGFDGSNYISTLKITVKNNCKVGITYISASMRIESTFNKSILWNGNFDLSGNITSNGGTGGWILNLKSDNNRLSGYSLAELDV